MATDVFLGGFPRVLFGFTLGICLHRFMEGDIILQRLSFFRVTHSYVVYILLVMVLAFPKTIRGLYPLFVLAFAGPSLVFMGARIQCRSAAERRLAQFLGWLSYPVYCLHYPIGRAAWPLGRRLQFSPTFTVALVAVTTIVLSIVLTKLAEEKTRRLMSKLFLGRITTPSGKSAS
jgi:peptidoglycan/LPS O-acetylase OafA/YrhL